MGLNAENFFPSCNYPDSPTMLSNIQCGSLQPLTKVPQAEALQIHVQIF